MKMSVPGNEPEVADEREPARGNFRRAPETEEEPRRSRRGWILAAVVVVAVILIVLLLRHRSAAKAETAKAGAAGKNRTVPVAVAAVEPRDVPVHLDGLGNVNALNTVTVKTRIDGQLLQFNFREGQDVRAGQELALIDPRPSEAQLAQAVATRQRDAATLQNAKLDLARYADLYKGGVISQQQYNTQQSQVRVNEGTIQADDAQIQQARLNVDYCHIKAPIDGRVGIRFVDPGNMVHAGDANGLLVITQMHPIAVLFTLPEDSLGPITPHLQRGDVLSVEAWSRDNTQLIARGRLLTIDNQIDPNTGTFRCKAVFDNADARLFPNQFVNARLQVDVRHNALTLPSAAVQHGQQGTYVYVVLPDKSVDSRPVTVAMTEGTTAVLGGGEVKAGDQVVTDGADKLQPKTKVEIAGQGRGGQNGGGNGAGRGGRAGGGGGRKNKAPQEPSS
jgi:multidrug efflux system membrane fusion protein